MYFQALVVMYAPLSAMYILNFSSSEFKVIKRVGENSINIEIQIRLWLSKDIGPIVYFQDFIVMFAPLPVISSIEFAIFGIRYINCKCWESSQDKAELPLEGIFFATQFPSLGIYINKKVGNRQN